MTYFIYKKVIKSNQIKGEFKCRHCDKRFANKRLRRIHERIVHGIRGDDMRNEKEIMGALSDYLNMPAGEFNRKYNLETVREVEGFVKALKWVLKEQ